MKKLTRCILFTFLLITTNIFAQTKKTIQLETGMHILPVKKIAADTAGKYLLTCSEDKTARLWDASNGKLLKIYRIPVNTRSGKLYACTISPDGNTIVLGGETDYEIKGLYSIYILDAQTAEIKNIIKGLPEMITSLEYSPNGQWFAVGLWGGKGVRIYETTTWNLKRNLQDYSGSVFSMSFNPSNHELATVSFDGMLRVYDKDFVFLKQTACDIEKEPISIAHNEKGTLIAIGYNQSALVEIRDAKNLDLLYHPPISDKNSSYGKISRLCFSRTTDILFGAGDLQKYGYRDRRYPIRIWNKNGNSKFVDKPILSDAIFSLQSLPNNKIAMAGSYPEIAVINDTGKILWLNTAIKAKYSYIYSAHFRINEEGNIFGVSCLHGFQFTFDVTKRELSLNASKYLQSPVDSQNGTSVSSCNDGIGEPSINGNRLLYVIGRYERCKCEDVSNDGATVCIATNRAIHLFSKTGERIWKIPIWETVSDVNISGNGKLVAVRFSDETIRWYSMKDGKELLRFFLNPDKVQWILFTPEGYYDASQGADFLLGIQDDNGPDSAPSFHPMSELKKEYYRPDIINKVLEIPVKN